MVLSSVPCQAVLLALTAVAVEFTAASNFRGATIQWKAVDPVNFDGRVSSYNVTVRLVHSERYRVKYRKWDRSEMGHLVLCEYLSYQLQTKTKL